MAGTQVQRSDRLRDPERTELLWRALNNAQLAVGMIVVFLGLGALLLTHVGPDPDLLSEVTGESTRNLTDDLLMTSTIYAAIAAALAALAWRQWKRGRRSYPGLLSVAAPAILLWLSSANPLNWGSLSWVDRGIALWALTQMLILMLLVIRRRSPEWTEN